MKILAKNRQAPHKASYVAVSCTMLLLLFIKCIHFYRQIDLTGYEIPFAAATVIILAAIYTLISVFSPKAAFITNVSLYVTMSVVLTIDLVYYSYMGKLPSFGLLEMAWQLGGVTGTVSNLVGHTQILPLFDLPIWFLIAINTQLFKGIRKTELTPAKLFIAPVTVILTCLLLIGQFMYMESFKLSFLSNEVITYHCEDLYKCLKPRQTNHSVNKMLYAQPSQKDNPNYGIAEGRNVFVIQVEALQEFVIGESYYGETITPFLNSLIENDSFYFENYYYQVGAGNTSDAEFAVNNSLYPSEDISSYEKYTSNTYNGLPILLKKNGYKETTVFHAYYEHFWSRNKAYPFQGFSDFISIEDMEYHPNEGCCFAINGNTANTDRRLYEDVVETVTQYKEPFYSFIITLSSHNPFALALSDRYVDADNMAPNGLQLYLQSAAYVDRTLEEFMDALKAEGLYDNSVFVIYGDHYAISHGDADSIAQIEAFTGEPYSIVDRFKVPLIIHVPGMDKAETLDTVGAHIDIEPTLLCLLGIDNPESVMFGHNLLDPDYDGIVYQLTHVRPGSFITKDVFYMHSEGGINSKAYDMSGNYSEVKDEYVEIAEQAIKTIDDCHALLDANDIMLN